MKRRLTILCAVGFLVLTVGCLGKSGDNSSQQNESVVIRSESLGITPTQQGDEDAAREDSANCADTVNEIFEMLTRANMEPQSIQIISPTEARAIIVHGGTQTEANTEEKISCDTLSIYQDNGKWMIKTTQ